MPARDGHVVEEDLAVGVPPGVDHVGVQQEAAARAGAALHDEQGVARRQRVHRGGVHGVELAVGGLSARSPPTPMVIVAVDSLRLRG